MIPMLGFIDKRTRYRGHEFTWTGATDSKKLKIDIVETLNKREHIKLRAQYKLDVLRTYVIPRFIFQLIHTELYPNVLIKMDIIIKKLIKRILHLLMSTSNEVF